MDALTELIVALRLKAVEKEVEKIDEAEIEEELMIFSLLNFE